MSHSLSKTVTTAETLNSKFHNRAAQTRVWHHGSYTHLLFSLWLWATWSIVGSHYIWRHWKSSADSHLWFPVFQVMSRPWMDDLQSRTQIAHSFAVNGLTTFSTAGMEQHYFFIFYFILGQIWRRVLARCHNGASPSPEQRPGITETSLRSKYFGVRHQTIIIDMTYFSSYHVTLYRIINPTRMSIHGAAVLFCHTSSSMLGHKGITSSVVKGMVPSCYCTIMFSWSTLLFWGEGFICYV